MPTTSAVGAVSVDLRHWRRHLRIFRIHVQPKVVMPVDTPAKGRVHTCVHRTRALARGVGTEAGSSRGGGRGKLRGAQSQGVSLVPWSTGTVDTR